MGKAGKQLCNGFKDRPSQLGEWESVSAGRRTKRPGLQPSPAAGWLCDLTRAPSFIPEISTGAPIQVRHDRLTQRDSPAGPEDGQRTASVDGFQPFSPPNTPFRASASFPLLSQVGTRLSRYIYRSEVSDDHVELIQLEGKARKEKKGILSCDWRTRALYTSNFCDAS